MPDRPPPGSKGIGFTRPSGDPPPVRKDIFDPQRRIGNQADIAEHRALADKLRSQAALTREDRQRLAELLERRGYSSAVTARHEYVHSEWPSR